MASKRMISKKVYSSAKFLQMPPSTRDLYAYLTVFADDDGIVEAFTVMRLTNASEDDLKILEAKEYIKILNSELVTFIYEFTKCNNIAPKKKYDSDYQKLLIEVMGSEYQDMLVESKAAEDNARRTAQRRAKRLQAQQLSAADIPRIIGVSVENPRPSIEENSIEKNRIVKLNEEPKKWTLANIKKHKEAVLEKAMALYPDKDCEKALNKFIHQCEIKDYKYKNHLQAYYGWVRDDKYNEYALKGPVSKNPKFRLLEKECPIIAATVIPAEAEQIYKKLLQLELEVIKINSRDKQLMYRDANGEKELIAELKKYEVKLIKNQNAN